MNILQDIMGLITKRKIKTPSDNDYIVSAAYTDTQERLKPQPKMVASLLNIGALKKYIQSSVTLQQVVTAGNTSDKSILVDVDGTVAINAIEARSNLGYGIYAESYGEDGVHSLSYVKDALHGTSELGNGVVGQSAEGYGVYAYSTNNDGINATSINKTAVYAQSTNENAMAAYSTAGYGLYAQSVNEDGVNTKSTTRHGLNTLSVSGDGVYSVSDTGHAIYAKNSGTAKTTLKVENTGPLSAIEAISTGGYCIDTTIGGTSAAGININGLINLNTFCNGLVSNISSAGSAVYAYNSGTGYGIYANTAAKDGGGVWSTFSDSRVKENINPYTKGLAEILLINPVSYDYNGLGGIKQSTGHVGVIAQEINTVLPETVGTYLAKLNEDDEENTELLTFNGTALTYALINAVKELKAEIELLKNN
jgi:hypothetical protein